MKFLAKIFHFFKSIITDFAKPVHGQSSSPVNVTTTFEALNRELSETIVTNEPTHVTHELETPTRFRRLTSEHRAEENGTDQPVIVMPPIEVMSTHKVIEIFVPEVVTTEGGERVRDFVFAEVAPQEDPSAEAPKKTRKRAPVAKTPAPKAKTKAAVKNSSKKVVKKVTKTKRVVVRKKKEEVPVPPEAMGFGF